MKARTLKKKFPQNRPRKTGHILKTIEMCCLFFPLSSSLQAEEKQPGWTA